MRQHLTCVQAATALSGAAVTGAELGSGTLVFAPGVVKAGDYAFSVGTAGSCTLVLRTVWPALMLVDAPSRLTARRSIVLPDGLADVDAAAMAIPGMSSWAALARRY